MKNLQKIGVQELGTQEMRTIEGGSWVGDGLRWVGGKLGQAWRWCKRHVRLKPIPSGWTVPGDII